MKLIHTTLPRVTVNKDNLILIIKYFLRDDNSRCLEIVKNIIDKHQHLDFLTLLQKINSCFYTDETITEALLYKFSIFLMGLIFEEKIKFFRQKFNDSVDVHFSSNNSNNQVYFAIFKISERLSINGKKFELFGELNKPPYFYKHNLATFNLSLSYLRNLNVKNKADEKEYLEFLGNVYCYFENMINLKICELVLPSIQKEKISSKKFCLSECLKLDIIE